MKKLVSYGIIAFLLTIVLPEHRVQAQGTKKDFRFKAGYTVSCTVNKKDIIIGTPIFVSDKSGQTSLDGTVKAVSPQLVVAGISFFSEDNPEIVIECHGTFVVSNMQSGMFSLNTKQGEKLSFAVQEIESASFKDAKKSVNYYDPDSQTIFMDVKWVPSDSDAYYKKLSLKVRVSQALIKQSGFTNIDALQEKTKHGYEFVWTNGKSFQGDIDCYKDSDGAFYHFGAGTYKTPEMTETVVQSKTAGFYTYIREDNTKGQILRKMEIQVPEDAIKQYGFWNTAYLISKGANGIFTLSDGTIYDGSYSAPLTDKGISGFTFMSGQYKWPNGDTFVGNYLGEWYKGIPTDGIVTLASGERLGKEWWKEDRFNLTKEQWDEFESFITPSDKVDYANSVYAARIINPKVAEINRLSQTGQYEKALSIMREYGHLARKTNIESEWVRLEKELETHVLGKIVNSIANALVEDNYSEAITLAEKYNGKKLPPDGEQEYDGGLKYEEFLVAPVYWLGYHDGSGESFYYYNTTASGRNRQGRYAFFNEKVQYQGWYNKGKMDGIWICKADSHLGHKGIVLQSYSDGVPDGLFVRVEMPESGTYLLQYCTFSDGLINSDIFFEGVTIPINYAGLINGDVVYQEIENKVPYEYTLTYSSGILTRVKRTDISLGTSNIVYSGGTHGARSYTISGNQDVIRYLPRAITNLHDWMMLGTKPAYYDVNSY